MRVGVDFADFALQFDATGFVAFELKFFSDHGHDFASVKTCFLRGHGFGE
jgi:hypothetical protein